jgi:hypothetical protein
LRKEIISSVDLGGRFFSIDPGGAARGKWLDVNNFSHGSIVCFERGGINILMLMPVN